VCVCICVCACARFYEGKIASTYHKEVEEENLKKRPGSWLIGYLKEVISVDW